MNTAYNSCRCWRLCLPPPHPQQRIRRNVQVLVQGEYHFGRAFAFAAQHFRLGVASENAFFLAISSATGCEQSRPRFPPQE